MVWRVDERANFYIVLKRTYICKMINGLNSVWQYGNFDYLNEDSFKIGRQ